ncbi:MAG: HisA/HisF-related TIM barrel protein [Acetobacteraceae bacterium]
MSRFILMLTKDDRTVSNAAAIYEEVRDTEVSHVGFKDIGLPLDEMRELAARIRADRRRMMLEVVSTSREAELRSIRAAIEIGVDYLLGGRHVVDALPLLAGTSIHYFPFCGNTVGHPTCLEGTIDEIVADARRLAMMPGVDGLDLLSYRFAGNAEELTRRVVEAVHVPVIAAGSIDRPQRARAVCDAGVWGFTVGSALFEGKFAHDFFRQQICSLVRFEEARQ